MLPVWPFRSRSIRHRTFGMLKPIRNGHFWRGRMPLPHAAKSVELHISGGSDGPTPEQESLFLRLAGEYPAVYETALRAVHQEYQRVLRQQPQLKWPAAADARDLEHLTPLDRIWFDDAPGRQFVLSFAHSRDEEHAFYVFFKDGKFTSVASER
jgi:hypothetical protein